MKKYFTLLVILTTALQLSAQEYRIGYMNHSMFHPGLSIAKVYRISTKVKTKTKKKKIKDISKANLFLPQINYYNIIRTENSFSLGAEVVRQRSQLRSNTWTFETGFGLHYVRSFNAGKTFRVEDGEITRVRFAGSNYFAPSLSYSIGKSFAYRNIPKYLNLYIKPQVFFLMPYNNAFVPSVNLQIGFKLPLIPVHND